MAAVLGAHTLGAAARVHTPSPLAFGHTCPVSDLFGHAGRQLLGRLEFPEPWRGGVLAAVAMLDDLDRQIVGIDRELKQLGAEHRYVPLLVSFPGIAWVPGLHDRPESGDITRFSAATWSGGKLSRTPCPAAGVAGRSCPRCG